MRIHREHGSVRIELGRLWLKNKKRYQRIRNRIQTLEAQANQTRFRKQIDIRTFVYHAA